MYPWFSQQFAQLSERIASNKLHHALLLQGIAGIGKAQFALELAKYLLCSDKQQQHPCGVCQACNLYKAGSHPDLHIVESEKQIGVDLIRAAIQKLSGTAQLSGAKVLVMFDAHSMTESSSNALLKTLEEPTYNTFLLLVSSKPERLLPTILSRCERLLLPSPGKEACRQWLSEQGITDVDPQLLEIYAASPLILLEELQQQGLDYEQFSQDLQALLTQRAGVIDVAAQWQTEAEKAVKWLQHWLTIRMKHGSEYQDVLWALHQSCIKANQQMLNPGINKSLQLSLLLTQVQQLNSILLDM